LSGIVRIADALGDRAGVDIAIVDVPAFLSVVCGSAAGEGGHGSSRVRLAQDSCLLQVS